MENISVFDFELSAEDMEAITALDTKPAVFLTIAILRWSNGWAVESWMFKNKTLPVIQGYPDGRSADWMKHVSDEEQAAHENNQ